MLSKQNKTNLITVIITTYNLSDLILNAINSVLDQSYKSIEIIVVDDCSNDNTKQILKKITDFKQIKYFYLKKNHSLSYARNYGLKKAKGNFVCFLDGDDTFPKDSIEKRITKLINNNQYNIVCGATNYFNSKNKLMYLKKVNKTKLNKENSPDEYLNTCTTPFITATVMYSKEVFNKIGYFDTNNKMLRSQDADFTYRLLKKYKILCVDSPVYNYYKGSKPKLIRIKHLFLQLRGKLYTISKHKKGFRKIYLITTNLIHFPLKLIHQIFFF
jgi:glycosyltransferase involved in cell wall biosynthesis